MKKQPKNKISSLLNIEFGASFERIWSKVGNLVPKKLTEVAFSPYGRLMRLDRPVGTLLLVLPVWWAVLFFATNAIQGLLYFALFTIGAFVMRSSGCIINDIVDRNLDPKVKRTANRPLASKELSVRQAIKLLALLLLIALSLLVFLPIKAIYLAFFAIIPISLYPFAKRFTYFPQVFLGLTFNLGVLVAGVALQGSVTIPTILLYIAAAFWTVGYDTIYAHQDKEDDASIGIKSTALKFGVNTPEFVWLCYKFMLIFLVLIGIYKHISLVYYLSLAISAYQLYWQAESLVMEDSKDCSNKFTSNIGLGIILCVGIFLGRLF